MTDKSSLGLALPAGRKRVPRLAMGKMTVQMGKATRHPSDYKITLLKDVLHLHGKSKTTK